MTATFAVVTVNYGSSALIAANMAGLALPAHGRLVIVDCFTSATERAAIQQVAIDLRAECVLLDENRGYGGGTNAGAERARMLGDEVIVALNPDARADASAVEMLARTAAGTRGLVSPRILRESGAVWFAGAELYLDDGTTIGRAAHTIDPDRPSRSWATGACFAMDGALWDELGGFDEDYFLYWEDIDLSHRVLDAGGELVLAAVDIVHDQGGTQRQEHSRAKSTLYYYYNIRNRMLYASKHLDADTAKRWDRASARVGYEILLRGGRRQLLTPAPWRAYLRGLRDARRSMEAGRG